MEATLPTDLLRKPENNLSKDHSLKWLLLATVITLVLNFIPFAGVITYPLRLFVTFVHETSHALAAILTFGSVRGLTISSDGSGLTFTQGGFNFLISSAGYLGTTLFGAGLLLLAQKESLAKGILSACGVLIFAVMVLFVNGSTSWLIIFLLGVVALLCLVGVKQKANPPARFAMMGIAGVILLLLAGYWLLSGTLFSWLAGIILGSALLALGNFTSPSIAHFLVNFLAVQCCLNSLSDIKTLFFLSAFSELHTDALNMQSMTGIPAIIWAIFWGMLSLGVLAATLSILRLRAKNKSWISNNADRARLHS